jgi:DNA adenine methylase
MNLSPLRYPGSKANFVPVVAQLLNKCEFRVRTFVEPYAGSASITLGLLENNIIEDAILGEQDPLLYAFWEAIFRHTDELLERFLELPITLETWHKLRPILATKSPYETKDFVSYALAGLFFNRANFSGILNGGPIGGMKQLSEYKIDCRTNKDEIVCRILAASTLADRVEVFFGDAVELIKKRSNRKTDFIYADPPYYLQGENLYRYFYRMGDHKRLAQTLTNTKSKWLLSYDDHHVIEFLYEKFNMRRHDFQYSARSPKQHTELLISNFDLPSEIEGWSVVKFKERESLQLKN